MDKKIIKILLAIIAFIGVGSIVIAVISSLGPDTLIKTPGVPRSESLRVVNTVESSPGYQVVENKFDGYKFTVPSNWLVDNIAGKGSGLKVYYDKDARSFEELPLELEDGLLLNILVLDNPKDIEIYIPADAEFQEIEINGERVFMSRYKALEEVGTDENFNDILEIIEDSQITAYIFRGGGKTYLVTCIAIATNFLELATLCEEQVQTFTITN